MYKTASVLMLLVSVSLFGREKLGSDFIQKPVTNVRQIVAAKGVVSRITPKVLDYLKFEIIKKDADNLDIFELENIAGKLVIRGTTGVALCSGYNYYLQKYCHCELSWCGDQLKIPTPFPTVPKKIRIKSPSKYRVYFNYCTLSYTATWWDWKRWQREIDFMALRGINMPLSPIGVEGVWYNVLQDFKMSGEEAQAFLCGPAYLAWQWMTNIQTLGGPMPKNWIQTHIQMGQKILERERSLGMIPIQQGFSGFVPVKFKKRFPKAKIFFKKEWAGRKTPTVQLDPLDPLFSKFGKVFMEEQKRLFGESHFYATDPFHEGSPPVNTPEYLSAVGKITFKVMQEHDPKAIWAMQAWSIRKDIACAVPKGKLLVLDLNGAKSRRTKNFWGHEFVTGVLHNFGNRITLHGDLNQIAKNIYLQKQQTAKNISGIGLFMEGIIHNPVFFNMVFDSIWWNNSVPAKEWVHSYATRRYGAESKHAQKAWDLLLQSAYRRGTNGIETGSIIATRPTLYPAKTSPQTSLKINYEPYVLVQAWQELMNDKDMLRESDGYKFDAVDVGRQALTNLALEIHKDLFVAYKARDKKAFQKASKKFLGILKDVDALIGTRSEYQLYNWVHAAREWGTTLAEKEQYEENARMLITRWGPLTMERAWDYSWRMWQGMISSYYLPRWTMFHKYLLTTLADGTTYDDQHTRFSNGRPALKGTPFLRKLTEWEVKWIESKNPADYALPVYKYDAVELSAKLLKKYMPDMKRVYLDKNRKNVSFSRKRKRKKKRKKKVINPLDII